MAEIKIQEDRIPEFLKKWAKHLHDDVYSLPVKIVREQAPQLLSDFEILTREQGKDSQQYRRAVAKVGIDRVLVVD